jgi:anti-sigma B factor antagonist
MRSFGQGGCVSSDFPSKLIIRPEMLDDSVVFHCSGRLTLEYSAELKDAVTAVMPHKRSVTIELGEVSHMDSSGLGAIVALYVSAKRENCEFRLLNYNPAIRKLFALSNLLSLFEAYGRAGTRMT